MDWIRDTGKSTAHLGDGKRRWRGEGVGKDYGWGYAYTSAEGDFVNSRWTNDPTPDDRGHVSP